VKFGSAEKTILM